MYENRIKMRYKFYNCIKNNYFTIFKTHKTSYIFEYREIENPFVGKCESPYKNGKTECHSFPVIDNENNPSYQRYNVFNPRNPHMQELQFRRDTFRYWPIQGVVNVEEMAEDGFYYIGVKDYVRCFFCDLGLDDWRVGEEPQKRHNLFSPFCVVLREKNGLPLMQHITTLNVNDVTYVIPNNPQMTCDDQRRETFDSPTWPRAKINQSIEDFVEAGFYYTGEGDGVRCFSCGGGLKHWEYNDIAWIEHAKWFPSCQFLLDEKGEEYILRMQPLNVKKLYR